MHLQDRDRTALSERLTERFIAAGYFRLTGTSFSDQEGFNREELPQSSGMVTLEAKPEIALVSAGWYNPELNYTHYMVPGILVILVTLIGLLIAHLIFHVPMLGSYWLVYLVSAIYMLVVLGMGLLISTVTETQQQAMFVAWFFMVIFTLMSGLFTAIESLPLPSSFQYQ